MVTCHVRLCRRLDWAVGFCSWNLMCNWKSLNYASKGKNKERMGARKEITDCTCAYCSSPPATHCLISILICAFYHARKRKRLFAVYYKDRQLALVFSLSNTLESTPANLLIISFHAIKVDLLNVYSSFCLIRYLKMSFFPPMPRAMSSLSCFDYVALIW